ncbi:MAG: hypothetical protein Q9222_000647 [Ikaeria aurantiellina]
MDMNITDEGSSGTFSGFQSDDHEDKDSTELELERAVFGDEIGFHDHLIYHQGVRDLDPGSTLHDEAVRKIADGRNQDDIEDLDDADLFILDSGPALTPLPPAIQNNDEPNSGNRAAVWHDSDDERIVVSLQKNPRLRKLRNFEDEDLVNGIEYTNRLRRQFERLYPAPKWATQETKRNMYQEKRNGLGVLGNLSQASLSDEEMSIDPDELSAPPLAKLLQQPNSLIQSQNPFSEHRRNLRPETIDMQRMKDVGNAQPSAIESLDFHPNHPLILSSGPASTISLHHISPRPSNPNPLLTSLHINATPLTTSAFSPPDGSKILFAGRRRYFHSWDLTSGRVDKISRMYGVQGEQKSMERLKLSPCGRWMGIVGSRKKGGGLVIVLDAHTYQWIAEVRVESNGGLADFAWWGDGEGMTILGKGGEAVEWDGRQKRIIDRWVDQGAVGTTIIAMGGRGNKPEDMGGYRWIAVGSSSGIVNVYDRKSWAPGKVPTNPQPTRALDNLTTPTSHLAFSPDGQLMLMASRWKRNALRLGQYTTKVHSRVPF